MAEIRINLSLNDVILSARKNYPVVIVNGVVIKGVKSLKTEFTPSQIYMLIEFDETQVKQENHPPYNNIKVLEKWYSRSDPKLSLPVLLAEVIDNKDII